MSLPSILSLWKLLSQLSKLSNMLFVTSMKLLHQKKIPLLFLLVGGQPTYTKTLPLIDSTSQEVGWVKMVQKLKNVRKVWRRTNLKGYSYHYCHYCHYCSTFLNYLTIRPVINRPGVAGAVLQTPPSLINSLSNWVILCEKIFKRLYLPNRYS